MTSHYFNPDPDTPSRTATVTLLLPDLHLRLTTDRGVFSPDRVDLGTRILLETVPAPPDHGTLLDLGCGYGPIALTMARRAPHATVVGVDTNRRALDLARRNAEANNVPNAHFHPAPEVPDPGAPLAGPFAALWSNPPIRIGKNALHALLTTWLARLEEGAHAHLVVHRNLGADSLQRWLDTVGHPAERVASRAGYRILRTTRHP
ncbi:class I SAM-dependent methyltransferase [Thermobifida halotolerans]|uniref:Class I SAM-dependent methyltransferase n=1 Tax=Thermobifida halotolerans TaxID=483545 RepID=A0A399G7K7_9ACTN|nr:methyltransferase [Thermobifida halotolerans]UOE21840.1 class I SAM-dependent methyltransferase [Thermobifida halotolerans]